MRVERYAIWHSRVSDVTENINGNDCRGNEAEPEEKKDNNNHVKSEKTSLPTADERTVLLATGLHS